MKGSKRVGWIGLALVLAGATACGNTEEPQPGNTGVSEGSSGPETATATGSGMSAGTTGDTGSGTTGASSTPGSSGDVTGSTSESGTLGAGSTGDDGSTGDTTGAGEVVDGAVRTPAGEPVRLMIYRAEVDADRCTRIRLESPSGGGGPFPGVTTPDYFDIDAIDVAQGADGCGDDFDPVGAVTAIDAQGTITWTEEGPDACPENLEIEVELDFPPSPAWVPNTQTFTGSLDVDACPLG